MSVDIATLSIRVDSLELKQAKTEMDRLTQSSGSLVGAISRIAGAVGFGVLVKQLFDTNVEFQRLGASLVTVTGSTAAAERAFAMIQNFAKTTPYELSEVTQAFIDLKTRGMDGSIGSLTSYGNMASAFGRSMTDLVRAVSGVAMGESEAIKSFGVQAMTTGNQVALTFKGHTEVVKRTTSEVEAYFKRLADANFASGMERQAKTLGGVLSNLKDQIAATFFAIGNAGVSSAISSSILGLTKSIAEATPAMARFAATTVSAVSSVLQVIGQYKTQLTGLVVILGAMALAQGLVASTMIGSGVAFLAQTARVVALTFAVSGYSVSATAAAVATGAWKAASLSGVAAFAVLAVAIAAIYIATRNMREEIEKVNKELANNQVWHDRAAIHKSFAEGTKDIEANVKLLQAALKGDKSAKIQVGFSDIAAYRREAEKNGTEAFERQIQFRVKAATTEQKLKEQLDAQNQALKDTAESAKKLHADRLSFFKAQGDAYNKAMFSESELLDMEMKRLKIANGLGGSTTASVIRTMNESTSIGIIDPRTVPDIEIARVATNSLGVSVAELNSLMKHLRRESMDCWDNIAEVVEQSSGHATDALVVWMDNLDGVGRSWKTLGDTVRLVIADMLIQMQRAVIQQQVMSPLMKWASAGISAWANPGSGGSGGSGGGSLGGAFFNGGLQSVQAPAASMQSSIVVNVDSSGAQATPQGGGQAGVSLGRIVEAACDQWAQKNMRPGGALAGAR